MSEAQLIQAGSPKDDVLASGPLAECLRKASALDAKGEGNLEVWHFRKGRVATFDGRSAERVKRRKASRENQERPIAARSAEASLAARQTATRNAEAEVAKALDRLNAEKSAEEEAEALAATAAKAAAPPVAKKAAKKKAASTT